MHAAARTFSFTVPSPFSHFQLSLPCCDLWVWPNVNARKVISDVRLIGVWFRLIDKCGPFVGNIIKVPSKVFIFNSSSNLIQNGTSLCSYVDSFFFFFF